MAATHPIRSWESLVQLIQTNKIDSIEDELARLDPRDASVRGGQKLEVMQIKDGKIDLGLVEFGGPQGPSFQANPNWIGCTSRATFSI